MKMSLTSILLLWSIALFSQSIPDGRITLGSVSVEPYNQEGDIKLSQWSKVAGFISVSKGEFNILLKPDPQVLTSTSTIISVKLLKQNKGLKTYLVVCEVLGYMPYTIWHIDYNYDQLWSAKLIGNKAFISYTK